MGENLHVRGEIEIGRSPSLTQEHDTERREDNAQEKKKFYVEAITLLFVIIVAGLTFWQGCLTRATLKVAKDTFSVANRPYVGIEKSIMIHYTKDASGEPVASDHPTNKTEHMVYDIQIRNFGPVPATNYRDSIRVFVDGGEVPTQPSENPGTWILFPTQLVHYQGGIQGDTYRRIMSEQAVLTFDLTVEYDSPSGHTKYCSKRKYYPRGNSFAPIGDCS